MMYTGRVTLVLIYIFIVLAWHCFYFFVDFHSSYVFMFEKGLYIWDFVFIPLLSPIFWWLGWQYDTVKFLSEKDALTGLYNRRFISAVFPKLLAQMDRKGEKLSVSILDCNNFKYVNDTYGHKTGDMIIKNISSLLLNSTRDSDIVARWGGDEFIIIAPYTDQQGTQVIYKRIEKGLQDLSKELDIDISVSMGTAVHPTDTNNMEELIKIADRNMYQLKNVSHRYQRSQVGFNLN